jgi:hypothetical protein
LTDSRGKTIPPYAILSHRWSDSEILIEDISNGTYKEREEGYRKLAFRAKQAAQDKLQYFWIDTCCIDTWNKSERSEAINSMFSVVQERDTMLHLLARRLSVDCARAGPTQRLGVVVPCERMVHSRMDAAGADRASVS